MRRKDQLYLNFYLNIVETGVFKKTISIYSIAEQDVLATLLKMSNSRIDFLLAKLLKGDKTIDQLGLALTKEAKFRTFIQ